MSRWTFLSPCQIILPIIAHVTRLTNWFKKEKEKTTLIDTSSQISDSASFNLHSSLNHSFCLQTLSNILPLDSATRGWLRKRVTNTDNAAKESPISLENSMTNVVENFFSFIDNALSVPSRCFHRAGPDATTITRFKWIFRDDFRGDKARRRQVNHRSLRGFYSRERISRGNTRAARESSIRIVPRSPAPLVKTPFLNAATRHFVCQANLHASRGEGRFYDRSKMKDEGILLT